MPDRPVKRVKQEPSSPDPLSYLDDDLTESDVEISTEASEEDMPAQCLLTTSQMRKEVEEGDDTETPNVVTTPTPLVSASSQVNDRSGWRQTPQDCRCKCEKRAYVIFHGRKNGIFSSWERVKPLVEGFSGARYKGYHSVQDAENAYRDALARGLIGSVPEVWSNHHYTTPPFTPCRRVRENSATPSSTPRCSSDASLGESIQRNIDNAFNDTPTPAHTTPENTRVSALAGGTRTTPENPRVSALAGGTRTQPRPIQGPTPATQRSPLLQRGPPPAYSVAGSARPPAIRYPFFEQPRTRALHSPENSWWVVCIGDDPGVYSSKTSAHRHAGQSSETEIIEAPEGREEANSLFVDLFSARLVRRLRRHPGPSSVCPIMRSIPLTTAPNDRHWYIVTRGPCSGVYEGRRTASRMAGEAIEHMLGCESERVAYEIFVDMYMSMKIEEH